MLKLISGTEKTPNQSSIVSGLECGVFKGA